MMLLMRMRRAGYVPFLARNRRTAHAKEPDGGRHGPSSHRHEDDDPAKRLFLCEFAGSLIQAVVTARAVKHVAAATP